MNYRRYLELLRANWRRIALWGGAGIAIVLLFSTLILPGIIRSQAETIIRQQTGRTAGIERIGINPFTLSATVKNFRLFEPDGTTPFVQLGSIKASVSLASLYRLAPVVRQLRIEEPRLVLVRTAENRYNFSDILDRLAQKPKKPETGPSRFSINNISLSKGSIDFNDRAVAGGKQHTIRELQLAVPFISNIPYLAEQYTDPRFSAVVNGARLEFGGKAKPLAKAVEASVHLKLDKLNLPHYLAYLPAQLPVRLEKGSLTLDLELVYRMHASKRPELTISGLTRLDELQITERSKAPLFSLQRFEANARKLELFGRSFQFASLLLDSPELQISRDSRGQFNFQRLLAPPPAPATVKRPRTQPEKTTQNDSQLPLVQIEGITLANGRIRFSDAQPQGGFSAQLQDISLKLKDFSTAQNARTGIELSLKGDRGEQARLTGQTVLTPLTAEMRFALSDLALQRGWPYLQSLLTAPVKGMLQLEGQALYSAADGLTLQDTGLTLQRLQASYGDKEGLDLARLQVSGIGFNQKENRAEVGELLLERGTLSLSREADGTVSPQKLLRAQSSPSPAPTTRQQPTKAATNEQKALAWLVKKIGIQGLTVLFKDKSFQEPPSFKLQNIRLATGNLRGPTFAPMPLSFEARLAPATPIRLTGTLTPQPFRYKGGVSIKGLQLKDFEDYLPDTVNIAFLAGSLDSTLKLDLAQDKQGALGGSFGGSAGIRGLHTIDTAQEEDLLKWESLQLDEIKGGLAPFSLGIRQIALNGVFARVAVRKDRTLNLQHLVTPAKQAEAAPAATQSAAATPPRDTGAPAAAPPDIRVDNLTIQDGTMLFSDAHLPQQFRSTFHNLGGRVSGLSSEMNRFAEVDLRGNLENHSPLQIKGRINPLRNDLFVDLTISFKDIDLTPATPYSGVYLGYAIDRGKLNLDLKYHIENKELKAENKVFVDQFTFGQSVESDKATKLPVRLGVALLKDRKGEIHLDLPVAGRTDDPKLSIWGVVWQVVVNLFVKAATSPFALLSSMMGSSEDLSAVAFAPGVSTLAPSEQQKLLTLAKALNDRPGLKVEIKGFVDREKDAEGYRNELLARKMRQEKLLEMTAANKGGEMPGIDKIEIMPQEYSRLLNTVYRKEKFPKPRNLIGLLKELPDAEMKKLIVAHTLVGEQELRQLANERVAAVRAHLIGQGKLPAERLFQKADDIYKPSQKEKIPASRAELNPVAQ